MNLPKAIFRRPVSEFAQLFTGIHVDEVRPWTPRTRSRLRPFLLIHNTEDRLSTRRRRLDRRPRTVQASRSGARLATMCNPGRITRGVPRPHSGISRSCVQPTL
jgi:hypothetical protein